MDTREPPGVALVIFLFTQMSKLLWETATHSFTAKHQNSPSSQKEMS